MTTDFKLLRGSLEIQRKLLMEQFERLKGNVPPTDERREGSPYGKREEEATVTAELEKRLALEKHLRAQLAEIEIALHKFELGTYGLCDNCGQLIEPSRLEALPQANLCLTCKARQARSAR